MDYFSLILRRGKPRKHTIKDRDALLTGDVDKRPGRSLPEIVLEAERRDRSAFWQDFVLSGDLNANLVHCKSSNTLSDWRRE